ncbi:MAG: uL22 family ribosomal protein [bacterium]|nr:uL22 family ribosomal protein [bacterium]
MEYQATAKYIHVSTRKVRLAALGIRRLSPERALAYLSALPKRAARPLGLVLSSALANAKDRQAKSETLRLKTIEVMGGPVMKRWRAVSRGQGHAYKKRMTHIRVILTDQARDSK